MDKKLAGLMVLFFLSFAVFSYAVVSNTRLSSFTRANVSETKTDLEKSLMVIYPLTVQADGTQQSTVTVFVRNKFDSPLENKSIILHTTFGQVQEGSVVSKDGKATFHLISTSAGKAELTAEVVGEGNLSQKSTVTFLQ
jgi:hypothetical protein